MSANTHVWVRVRSSSFSLLRAVSARVRSSSFSLLRAVPARVRILSFSSGPPPVRVGSSRFSLLRPGPVRVVVTMNQPDNDSGFSLVELMIAIAVLTFGLVSIVGLTAYVAHANIDSNITSVLATAAQTKVDQLKSATWTRASCDPALQVGGSLTSNTTGYYTTVSPTQAGDLIVRWQVASGGTPDYRYVTVNVALTTANNDFPNGLSVSTIILRQ